MCLIESCVQQPVPTVFSVQMITVMKSMFGIVTPVQVLTQQA